MATDKILDGVRQECMRVQEQIDRAEGDLTGSIWDMERRMRYMLQRIKIQGFFNTVLLMLLLLLMFF